MVELLKNYISAYEDSFLMYLINNTSLNDLLMLLALVLFLYGLNYLINLTIVISKLFTKRYRLYKTIDLEDMYWKDFLDRAHKRK